ncbi:MAG: lamin tail domain-containing protein [Chitinophagaceae bacterium]|nr:lamin tail domain-containing protein [Chitinophagaceae bacterium]
MNLYKYLLLFCCVCAFQFSDAQVVMNEVQSDAGNFDQNGGDWLELKNIGGTTADLSCWRISNGASQISIPAGLILQAGEYLLIGSASKMMCATCDYHDLNTLFTLGLYGFGNGSGTYANTIFLNTDPIALGGCDCLDGTGELNNASGTGDRIILFDDQGNVMDAMMYAGGNNYGTGALSVNFPNTLICPPLSGANIPAVGDAVYNGRTVCNDLGGCNSSYARMPDGNNGAAVSWTQTGNLSCTGCTSPCSVGALNTGSDDLPTPGLSNSTSTWSATLNGNPVNTVNTALTVCGATPLTFQYQIGQYSNVALSAIQSTGNLGSYIRLNNSAPTAYTSAAFNNATGVTTLSATVTPGNGTNTYEFVWGDANTNCTTCPGTSNTANVNNASNTAKECYVYHTVTVTRENALTGSPLAACSLPGFITISGATGTNILYTLQKQTTTGGPFNTIAGPQSVNTFSGIIDDDADPALPNYQVLVSSNNTVCVNPAPLVVPVPIGCLGNPACAVYATSGAGQPTYTPAGGSSVCSGTPISFSVDISGVCTNGYVEMMYDYNPAFDPYTQGISLGTTATSVGVPPTPSVTGGRVYISEFVPRPYNVAPCASDGSNPNSGEYIELYNAGPGTADMSGWLITDGDWTVTIPAGTLLVSGGYFLIGGGGTLCAAGAVPDLNVETCNCTSGQNNGGNGTDFMNLTNGGECFGLFDCSNNFIDGVSWNNFSDVTSPSSLVAGCGNYLTSKTPVLPATTATIPSDLLLENVGGGFSGSGTFSGGRARDASGLWTVGINNLQAGGGFNGTPKAVNGAFTMWNGGTTPFGTQCPAPPVTATMTVNLPDTCSPLGNTNVTLKAIYKPNPVTPCTAGDVTASATFTIPTCSVLTITGDGDYCAPSTALVSLNAAPPMVGSHDIVLSNGVNTATLNGVSGSGPFNMVLANGGVWTIASATPPLGTCPPKTEGSANIAINPIPAITSSPATANACYIYGFDLASLESQIITNPVATSFTWYDQPSGGSPIVPYVNPNNTTTYYVAPVTGTTAYCEGALVPVILNIEPLPLPPSVSCNGSTLTFTPLSPNCFPTPCTSGYEYSPDGLLWYTGPSFTAADPGWSGWGSATNSTLYMRNLAALNCINYVTYVNPCLAPLPAQLFNFSGRLTPAKTTELKWFTAQEQDLDRFDIERSNDQIHFMRIGQMKAKGQSQETLSYMYHDVNPAVGDNYYRLRIVDQDGQYTYSPVVQINLPVGQSGIQAIYPNPSGDLIHVSIHAERTQSSHIQIMDMVGQTIVDIPLTLNAGNTTHEISLKGVASGHYMVKVMMGNDVMTGKFVKE